MKKILMIGTGGTIASEMTPEGLTPELTPDQLLRSDFQPSGLQEPPERCRGDALSQTGNNTAGNEDIFCHDQYLLCVPQKNNVLRCLKGALGPLHQ